MGFYHRKFDVKFTAFTREELTDYYAEELTYFCPNFGHLESQQVLGFYQRKFDVKFTAGSQAFTREELTHYCAEELTYFWPNFGHLETKRKTVKVEKNEM